MAGKGCWGQWFCHPGVLWPLEDAWSISLWEIWCFATGQQNAVLKWIVLQVANTVSAAASGLAQPQTPGFVTTEVVAEMPRRSINSNMSLSWHFLKISAAFSPVLCCFLCVPIVFPLTWNKLQSLTILPLAGLEPSFSNWFFPFHSAPVKIPLWNRRSEQTGAEENKSWPKPLT